MFDTLLFLLEIKRIEILERELEETKQVATSWKLAWFRQRESTGKSYWNGYKDGKNTFVKGSLMRKPTEDYSK
jgi:hypothetical protein